VERNGRGETEERKLRAAGGKANLLNQRNKKCLGLKELKVKGEYSSGDLKRDELERRMLQQRGEKKKSAYFNRLDPLTGGGSGWQRGSKKRYPWASIVEGSPWEAKRKE